MSASYLSFLFCLLVTQTAHLPWASGFVCLSHRLYIFLELLALPACHTDCTSSLSFWLYLLVRLCIFSSLSFFMSASYLCLLLCLSHRLHIFLQRLPDLSPCHKDFTATYLSLLDCLIVDWYSLSGMSPSLTHQGWSLTLQFSADVLKLILTDNTPHSLPMLSC